jgi:hypothetical protein
VAYQGEQLLLFYRLRRFAMVWMIFQVIRPRPMNSAIAATVTKIIIGWDISPGENLARNWRHRCSMRTASIEAAIRNMTTWTKSVMPVKP